MEGLLNGSGFSTNEDKQQQNHEPTPPRIKHTTLSGLLNIIGGAASVEGRLLILTTNHADQLDEALVRPGRCDSKFRIGFATKITAEQTFKRIFNADACKRHQEAAIDRFAQAFKEQFPVNRDHDRDPYRIFQ